ncbi:hypothetical protein [Mucilaginibacter segetis]|uniref:Uncharacterized protein n=1 Tax=Mucilaginibacter segetis TaxID=2793071 RepID=A0A934PX67_9SPHI|nr:hypothetical protein [Mucilaginibacter segetis]MBK0380741.1 hypothetical protein [Mucilaginibacter segetis]
MKRKVIYSLIAGLVLAVVYSFTVLKPVNKKVVVKTNSIQQYACSTVISNINKSYNYGNNTVTITFSISGDIPSYTNCGGNYYCSTGTSFSVNTTSLTVTIPLGPGGCGGNGRLTPVCSGGMSGNGVVFSF